MTGDAEAPRMGEAVAVAHQDVGRDVEHGQRIEEDRHFAERQQAGNIGKTGGPARHGAGDGREIGHAQDHHRAARYLAAVLESNVEAGDMLERTPAARRQAVLPFDFGRQLFLQRDRLLGREIPAVK